MRGGALKNAKIEGLTPRGSIDTSRIDRRKQRSKAWHLGCASSDVPKAKIEDLAPRMPHTGLEGLSVDAIQERLKWATSSAERIRYIRQLKWLKDRNRQKARGGNREPKKPSKGEGVKSSGQVSDSNTAESSTIGDFVAFTDSGLDQVSGGDQQLVFHTQSLALDILLDSMQALDSFWLIYASQPAKQ